MTPDDIRKLPTADIDRLQFDMPDYEEERMLEVVLAENVRPIEQQRNALLMALERAGDFIENSHALAEIDETLAAIRGA